MEFAECFSRLARKLNLYLVLGLSGRDSLDRYYNHLDSPG